MAVQEEALPRFESQTPLGRSERSACTPAQGVRDAVGLMTAWTAQPDGPPDLLIEVLGGHLGSRPPVLALAEATELIMGMTTLCGALLALNEFETGVDMQVILREIALQYAREDLSSKP
jgi:hypothetical protein